MWNLRGYLSQVGGQSTAITLLFPITSQFFWHTLTGGLDLHAYRVFFFNSWLVCWVTLSLKTSSVFPFFHLSRSYAIALSFHKLVFPVKIFIAYPQRSMMGLSTTRFYSFLQKHLGYNELSTQTKFWIQTLNLIFPLYIYKLRSYDYLIGFLIYT